MIERNENIRWQDLQGMGIETRQDRNEMELAFFEMKKTRPDVHVEIGAFQGGSLYYLAGALEENATIIVIDLCDRGEEVHENLMKVMEILSQDEGFNIHFIQGRSQDETVLSIMKEQLAGRTIDSAMIDGSHKFGDVMADFNNLKNLMSPGGRMFFHDVMHKKIGAYKAWLEIQKNVESCFLIFNEEMGLRDHATGIGVAIPNLKE